MWDWIGKLDELRRRNQPALLVTVTKSSGSTPGKQGSKMIVLPDGSFFGTIGGGTPEYLALEDARRCFETMRGTTSSIPLQQRGDMPACGGTMELYMELVNTNPNLYLFGAGHIGQALCQVLDGTPFRIHLVDEREEWLTTATIPGSVIRHHCRCSEFIDSAVWCDRNTYVTVATYSGAVDQQVIEEVLPHPARFIGMVGSRGKWGGMQKNLQNSGFDLSRVTCPAGHFNGGNSPKEIAISIADQLLSVYHGVEKP